MVKEIICVKNNNKINACSILIIFFLGGGVGGKGSFFT